jgi:hypothetical protein
MKVKKAAIEPKITVHYALSDFTACGTFICGDTIYTAPDMSSYNDFRKHGNLIQHSCLASAVTCSSCKRTKQYKDAMKKE